MLEKFPALFRIKIEKENAFRFSELMVSKIN